MSNLLKEKHALAKLKEELDERKGKLCRSCKGFGHLAQNCRNRKEREKGAEMPQNKFEILSSRVMQCGVEERVVKSMRTVTVRCFKCGEEGHKCRECPLWERKVKRVARPKERKAHQRERRPMRPIREKAQEGERRLRRMEEEKAMMGIKRFDHETKMKARSERRNLQTASQLCTKQVGTGEINQIIESLLKVKVQRITKTY